MSLDDRLPPDDWRDLLSALLDGELAPDEEERVRDLVATSPEAQDELAELARVRTLVRDLPAVDPPFGFYERLLRSPTAPPARRAFTWAKAGGALAVAAAAVVVIVGVTPATDRIVPPVEAYAARHLEMDPISSTTPATAPEADAAAFTPVDDGELDAMGAPDDLADGFERMSGYQGSDGALHLVFSDGAVMVSVYEQVGEVAWDRLPSGTMSQMGETKVWTMVGDAEEIMVFERGMAVYTVVADVDTDAHDEMVELATDLPPGADPTMVDRLRSGCRSVVARFSMGATEP